MQKALNQNPFQSGVGLVLSGGGAKGAYQAGVIRGLAEMEIAVDAVSGASIGSLNAAIVASAPDLHSAATRMGETWLALGSSDNPIKADVNSRVLVAAKLVASLVAVYAPVGSMVMKGVASLSAFGSVEEMNIYCNKRVAELMRKHIDLEALATGLPMWISLYPSEGLRRDMQAIVGGLLGKDTAQSDHIRINTLKTTEERLKAMLASAAIPLAFPQQEINGKKYVDGGIGGWRNSAGNTPIKPLIDHGCKHVIVTHLSDGSHWDRHDFPGTTIIEIRPTGIARNGMLKDLLNFDLQAIESWIDQGYKDTLRCVEPVKTALKIRDMAKRSELKRDTAVSRLQNDGFHID